MRANLDGTNVVLNFIPAEGDVCGLTIANGYIYWGSGQGLDVGRARVNGSQIQPKFQIFPGSPCGTAITNGKP